MILKIVKQTAKPFQGRNGEDVDYYWYTAEKPDGFVINFGSVNGEYEVGQKVDIMLESTTRTDGRSGYREVKT